MKKIFSCLIWVLFLFSPILAHAFAGLSDNETWHHYDERHLIGVSRPSPLCTGAGKYKYCLRLTDLEENSLPGLPLLDKINCPTKDPALVFGKTHLEKDWLIYDVKDGDILFRDTNYKNVLSKWKEYHAADPEMIDRYQAHKTFKETIESRKNSYAREAGAADIVGSSRVLTFLYVTVGTLMILGSWAFVFLVISFIILSAGLIIWRVARFDKKKRRRHVIQIILLALVMILVLSFLFYFFESRKVKECKEVSLSQPEIIVPAPAEKARGELLEIDNEWNPYANELL